jgi:dolichyl-phosphate beta-glucosyltransferase
MDHAGRATGFSDLRADRFNFSRRLPEVVIPTVRAAALSNPFLSIIIPVHNEETRLPSALDGLAGFLKDQPYTYEVLVVENGSNDRTLETAKSYQPGMPYLRILCEEKRGKGLAVQRGMLEAQGEYRIYCDVDFSMPVGEINRFIPPKQLDTDIAIASREAPGAVRYHEPIYRHLMGRVFNSMVRWMALPGLQDTQCGFKCFCAGAANQIFRLQTLTGWSFDVEVLFIARRKGYRIVEVPIPWYYNPNSRVRIFQDSWNTARDLIDIRQKARQGLYDRPV